MVDTSLDRVAAKEVLAGRDISQGRGLYYQIMRDGARRRLEFTTEGYRIAVPASHRQPCAPAASTKMRIQPREN